MVDNEFSKGRNIIICGLKLKLPQTDCLHVVGCHSY